MKISKLHGFLFFMLLVQSLVAQVPKLKNPTQAVQDYVNLLSEKERHSLNEKLRKYEDSTSTGIAIAILPTTEDDINYQAAQILSQWKIGKKGKNNGVLILMNYQQRKVAISTGYGVEEFLTDALSKQIISQEMIPNFKNGNYYQGFDQATTSIMQILSGNFKKTEGNLPVFPLIIIIAVIALYMYLFSKNQPRNHGGGNNQNSGGFDIFDMIILSNMGRNSGSFGGFGSSSGGSFGGFGGGMGGGGGASGSW